MILIIITNNFDNLFPNKVEHIFKAFNVYLHLSFFKLPVTYHLTIYLLGIHLFYITVAYESLLQVTCSILKSEVL